MRCPNMHERSWQGPEAGHRLDPWRVNTVWAFGILAAANVALTFYLNSEVLTDEAYRALLAEQGSPSDAEALLAFTRRWEAIGYLLAPITLFVRIGVMALLVQLALLLLGRRTLLLRVFRAGTWAQYAFLLGTLAQLIWIATLPAGGITSAALEATPGSILGLIPSATAMDDSLRILLQRITLFDFGWILLFTLGLEDQDRVPGLDAGAAVVAVWTVSVLARWGFWLYLGGLV